MDNSTTYSQENVKSGTDGGDKDSTDNVDEIYSTQQPEDPSECTEPVSLCCCCDTGHFQGSNKAIIPALHGCWQFSYNCVISGDTVIYCVLKRANGNFVAAAAPFIHISRVKWSKSLKVKVVLHCHVSDLHWEWLWRSRAGFQVKSGPFFKQTFVR